MHFHSRAEISLITGGGGGLGFGIAECFVQAGAKSGAGGFAGARFWRRLQKKLPAPPRTFEAHDILELDQADALVKRVTKRVGDISILVNNAGGNFISKNQRWKLRRKNLMPVLSNPCSVPRSV